jgi:hypothetical protein
MSPLFHPQSKHPLIRRLLLSALLVAASAMGAYAQGVHEYSFPSASGNGGGNATSTGGGVYSGTAVPTGRGPLDQPIPPAASSYNSRYGAGRVATPTNPSPYPFGR